MPRDFRSALGEATRDLGAEMSTAVSHRLRARVKGGPRGRRLRWGRVGLVVVLLALATVPLSSPRPESLGGYLVSSAKWSAAMDSEWIVIREGEGALRDEGLGGALELKGPARLRHLHDGVELAEGTVELDIDHDQLRASPFRVRVVGGEIEVIGTRFTVTQRKDGGEVTLHRGSIRFRADDGQTRVLSPGQSLRWPLLPRTPARERGAPVVIPVKRVAVSRAPRPLPLAPAKFDADALLERIAVLRSRERYEEAVAALTEALREVHAATTDERLSFELGAILTRQLQEGGRACEHWRAHRARFGAGRYAQELMRAEAELQCESN